MVTLTGWGLWILSLREGRLECAARLFATRFWREFATILSPIERAWGGKATSPLLNPFWAMIALGSSWQKGPR